MADARSQYHRQLRRRRRSARRWSVLGGALVGAAAVLTPYHGIGLPDAAWAAAAGGASTLAWWRWSDLRSLVAAGPPEPQASSPPTWAGLLGRVPGGRMVLDEIGRARASMRMRGTSAAPLWARLDQAGATLAGLKGGLTGHAAPAVAEAAVAAGSLRTLAERVVAVERALRIAPPDARPGLGVARDELRTQLADGVEAYERLVAAAAGYVAEEGRTTRDNSATDRLVEATDLLRGIAEGLSELRTATP